MPISKRLFWISCLPSMVILSWMQSSIKQPVWAHWGGKGWPITNSAYIHYNQICGQSWYYITTIYSHVEIATLCTIKYHYLVQMCTDVFVKQISLRAVIHAILETNTSVCQVYKYLQILNAVLLLAIQNDFIFRYLQYDGIMFLHFYYMIFCTVNW